MKKNDSYLVLHDIRSVINVGAIFRTAECAGISKIYLTGYTPAPVDRFGRERPDFKKAALGAQKLVSWQEEKDVATLLEKLKKDGVHIVAVEQEKNSIDYKKLEVEKDTAFVFGNEVKGLPKNVLERSDQIAEISLRGKKESLNVSVSVGIFLFRVLGI